MNTITKMNEINLTSLSINQITELMEKLEKQKQNLEKENQKGRLEATRRLGEIQLQLSAMFSEVENLCSKYSLDFYFYAPNDTSVSYNGETGDGWYSSY